MLANKKSLIVFSFLFVLFAPGVQAQLSGTYTIDTSKSASATNYKSFSSAVSDLVSGKRSDGGTVNGPGVNSSVVFKIADGIYNEQLTIRYIIGSNLNPIIFTSASSDSSKVILTYPSSTTSANNFTLLLDSIGSLTFKGITIQRTGSNTYGRVMEIKGGCSDNTFSNNRFIGIKKATKYAGQEVIYSGGDDDLNQVFQNNVIRYGWYGFYLYGTNSLETGTIIQGNVMDSTQVGMNIFYQGALKILNNKLQNINVGMKLAICNGFKVVGNSLSCPGMGADIIECGTYMGDTSVMINNFINVGPSEAIIGYENGPLNFYYNTVCLSGKSTFNSIALYADHTFAPPTVYKLFNNNFVNLCDGYCIYMDGPLGVGVNAGFNNYFTTGKYVGNYDLTDQETLPDWQAATGTDSASISVNPKFISNTNLHTHSVFLNGAAMPLSFVGTDFDNDKRDSLMPDIGADEFIPNANDAGIVAIDTPGLNICKGGKNVYASIRNFGSDTLKSAVIRWYVNGNKQKDYAFSGNIASKVISSPFQIGTYPFSQDSIYRITAYAMKPNGASDADSSNDTTTYKNIQSGISGTFTIGGIKADYATFSDAAKVLNIRGVCGPVVFNVRDGVYREQVDIRNIPNSSTINTIVFQSQSGDSTKVILTYPSSNTAMTNNFILHIAGSNISFQKISFIRTDTGSYGNCIRLEGDISSVSIRNCVIHATKKYVNARDFNNFGIGGKLSGAFKDILIINNSVKYGRAGIYVTGTFKTKNQNNLSIMNNTIDSFETIGIGTGYTHPFIFGNNISHSFSAYAEPVGIVLVKVYDSAVISNNKINFDVPAFGISLGDCRGKSLAQKFLVSNNFISISGKSRTGYANYNNEVYGLFSTLTTNARFYNNSVIMDVDLEQNKSQQNSALAIENVSSSHEVVNNILVNKKGGFVMRLGAYLGISDNNCFFTNGPYPVFCNGVNFKTHADWQATSSLDANSLTANPFFYGKSDLHIRNVLLDRVGQPIPYVKNDIDLELRDTLLPDIGADEFTPDSLDAGISSIDSPSRNFCNTSKNIWVKLHNYGASILTSANVLWEVNSSPQTTFVWKGKLNPGKDTLINIGSYTFSKLLSYTLKMYSSLPNGGKDAYAGNDTIISPHLQNGLNGNFKIGGAGRDYTDFSSAAKDLNDKGICGSVIFNVSDSTYEEQVEIDSIAGTSYANTVTFQSISGDSSKVILTYPYSATSALNNYTLLLRGSDHVIFKGISVERTSAKPDGHGRVIELRENACNNIFSNCLLTGTGYKNAFSESAVIYSSVGENDSLTIENCNLLYGTPAVLFASMGANGLLIKNNIFDKYFFGAIYLGYNEAPVVENNEFKGMFSGSGYAIQLNGTNSGGSISGNKILFAAGGRGIDATSVNSSSSVGAPTSTLIISNNFISLDGKSTSGHGIYLTDCFNTGIYFNNILLTKNIDTVYQASTAGLYTSSPIVCNHILSFATVGTFSTIDIANNNLINMAGSQAMYLVGSKIPVSSDYNNLYTSGPSLVKFALIKGGFYSRLSDWFLTTGNDANSISADPVFVSATDLHLKKNSPCARKGIATPMFQYDIDGDYRKNNPDIGADEFSFYPEDAGITSVMNLMSSICSGIYPVRVVLKNFGVDTLKNVTVNWSVNGVLQAPSSWKGLLANKRSDTSVSLGAFNFKAGINALSIWTSKPNGTLDSFTANDSFKILVNVKASPSPNIFGRAGVCIGDTNLYTVTAYKGSKYIWSIQNNTILSGQGKDSIQVNWKVQGKDTLSILETNSSGCSVASSLPVSIGTPVSAHFTLKAYSQYIFHADDSSLSAASYTWNFGDSISTAGYKTTHSFASTGLRTITLAVNNQGCPTSFDTTLKVYTGMNEGQSFNKTNISIYPNPVHSSSTVLISLEKSSSLAIYIYDMKGMLMKSLSVDKYEKGDHQIRIDREKLSLKPGTYILRIKVNDEYFNKLIIVI